MNKIVMLVAIGCLSILGGGCVTTQPTDVENAPGRATIYEDVASPGSLSGVGIESQDIVSMADAMVRDIMAYPEVVNKQTAPRIVVDGKYFVNESSKPIDKDMIMDRIRVQLNRAARGKLVFIARHEARMVEDERALENDGVVSEGSQGHTQNALGWDYRMSGRIRSRDQFDPNSGVTTMYHLVTFELVERGTGVMVWTNMYEFKKSAADDLVYR